MALCPVDDAVCVEYVPALVALPDVVYALDHIHADGAQVRVGVILLCVELLGYVFAQLCLLFAVGYGGDVVVIIIIIDVCSNNSFGVNC